MKWWLAFVTGAACPVVVVYAAYRFYRFRKGLW